MAAAPALPGRALTDAVALHRADRLDAAEQAYATIRKRDPDYPEAQRLRAVIAQQRGQSDVAIRLLRRALEQQPANPVYHHSLAELLRVSGDSRAAIAAYRRAFALQPERVQNGLDLGDALARYLDPGHVAVVAHPADREAQLAEGRLEGFDLA